GRRAPCLERPAVGGRVCGDVGDRGAVARFFGRGSRPGACVVRQARAAIRPLVRDLSRRTITAVVYAVVVLVAVFAPPPFFAAVLVFAVALGSLELVALSLPGGSPLRAVA